MALRPVSDQNLLAQLNGGPAARMPVSDPALLAQLNGPPEAPPQEPPAEQPMGAATPWVSAAMRPVINAASALPGMMADAGVSARNLSEKLAQKIGVAEPIYALNRKLAGDSNVAASILPGGPSQQGYGGLTPQFQQSIDQTFPAPTGLGGRAAEMVSTAVLGSQIPAPQAARQAPAGFVPPAESITQQTFRDARRLGYVAPPSQVKPTLGNQIAEGAAGKTSVAQAMASHNQDVTNQVVRRSLGLADDTPLTLDTLKGVRAEAGKVYEQVAKSGEIRPDSQFIDDLAQLGKSADDIAKDFPDAEVAASEKVGKLVDSLLRDKFDARSALEYLKELRAQASTNLSFQASSDPAKRALGMAQKEAASTLEDLITRHLGASGDTELAGAFDAARKTIAKTYSVQSALNESTGNVVATALGGQLKKGKPLSGDLELAARFARTFPKATREVTESFPGISPWDIGWGGLGSMAVGNPLPWLYPFARIGLRHGLMTPTAQRAAAGYGLGSVPSGLVMGPATAGASQ